MVKLFLFQIGFIFLAFVSYSQLPPPPASIANEDCKPFIDKLIEVANYEDAFNTLKDSMINEHAKRNDWNALKVEEAIDRIQFENDTSMFYNAFSPKSKVELMDMISYYSSLSPKDLKKEYRKYNKIVIHNFKSSIKYGCIDIDEKEK